MAFVKPTPKFAVEFPQIGPTLTPNSIHIFVETTDKPRTFQWSFFTTSDTSHSPDLYTARLSTSYLKSVNFKRLHSHHAKASLRRSSLAVFGEIRTHKFPPGITLTDPVWQLMERVVQNLDLQIGKAFEDADGGFSSKEWLLGRLLLLRKTSVFQIRRDLDLVRVGKQCEEAAEIVEDEAESMESGALTVELDYWDEDWGGDAVKIAEEGEQGGGWSIDDPFMAAKDHREMP